mgnify:CR=1 FL=1
MELKDIATLIEDQGRGWEAFKTANEERLKAIESKGYAPADLTETVAKINADLAEIGAENRYGLVLRTLDDDSDTRVRHFRSLQ